MNVTEVGRKESRIPCCGKGYPQRDSAEHEGYVGALTDKRITENNNTNADSQGNGLLESLDIWCGISLRLTALFLQEEP